jgi:maltose O-acetyltransferase
MKVPGFLTGSRSALKLAAFSLHAWLLRILVSPPALAKANEQILKASLGHCGANVSIRQPAVIEAPSGVSIGDDVDIASYVHMWGNVGITIGPRCMIASHVAISSVTHDPLAARMHGGLVEAPVVIGADVWIGAHAVILPGVQIGDHAVIAACALVRENVPAYAVVAGVPARVVRNNRLERQLK